MNKAAEVRWEHYQLEGIGMVRRRKTQPSFGELLDSLTEELIATPDAQVLAAAGAPGSTDAERAAWLADKIVALGDYAKEAAAMLLRWPVAQPVSTDSASGSPGSESTRPDQPKLPESGGIGISSIGLGAEGEQ